MALIYYFPIYILGNVKNFSVRTHIINYISDEVKKLNLDNRESFEVTFQVNEPL